MAGREARRNEERLYYKFISQYFEGLHHDLFEKANALFKEAKEKNATVKDLTKTVQFMSEVTPELPVPRYYKNRPINKPTPPPQMALQIQLFDVQDLAALTPSVRVPSPPIFQQSTVPACVPDVDGDVQDLAASTPPVRVPSPPIFQQSTVPACVPDVDGDVQDLAASTPSVRVPSPIFQQSTVPVCVPDVDCEPLPLLTESAYKDLVAEIRKDPELSKILNDFPTFDDDDCETMNNFVWDSIQPSNDISPLEMEMMQY